MLETPSIRYAMLTVLLSVFMVSGCSTLPKTEPETQPPMHEFTEVVPQDKEFAVQVYDPLEGFNRGVYRFNYYFDKYLFLPVVRTYQFILPDYAENRVSNFIDNVYEFNNFTNNLLQLKFKQTGITLARFAINTTVGIAGLWDPATSWGLYRQTEDFGQTLGHYGVGHGPYLVLPVLGPSNLRDTTGLVGDTLAFNNLGPPYWVDDDDVTLAFTVVTAIDKRKRVPFRYYGSGSPFEYEQIRMLYTKKRELEIDK
ncbi:MAG: VacJ family lipoprotein [Deltaproteobacteria bacterium]|jgi:phospholipid-binding lipoprotein MlaA|nr:VacJ family lipoprotein [Deltaproteobacteria bacterium]